ncbi:TniB family NTP-binding protein [Bradyrhizobium sp. SSUT77]|uniref:TniB family NTP-binding protein n=1 Tax=Bradyrhizobium sp. SSUT77 TaxID=3040603 RepID=UPI00244B0225|nr:TniB family NTP-binding protein [Bradyrhizobium sp. SSUT77]MDH2347734.1 TniB family NTP-binding protein [Bradyrhizobium sp. SSUT77]
MSNDYAHLRPTTRPFAAEDAGSRIRRIRTDRWIGYARAEAVLAALEDLLSFPKRLRMPNLLLVGPTNNGKTMIVEKFRRTHLANAASEPADGAALIPVLKVQMPSGPDEGRFFGAILEALGMPFNPRDRIATKQDTAVRLMRATNVRLLVIDELHNLLSGTAMQQRRLLNVLRWLGNELQIPLVGVGTTEALRAIRSDEQLVNRFEPFPLPVWTDDDEYRRLLSTLEAVLPLRRPSNLTDPAMTARILSAAEGVLGEIIAIVVRAAVKAIETGAETISPRMIERAGFIRPSERRRVAI